MREVFFDFYAEPSIRSYLGSATTWEWFSVLFASVQRTQLKGAFFGGCKSLGKFKSGEDINLWWEGWFRRQLLTMSLPCIVGANLLKGVFVQTKKMYDARQKLFGGLTASCLAVRGLVGRFFSIFAKMADSTHTKLRKLSQNKKYWIWDVLGEIWFNKLVSRSIIYTLRICNDLDRTRYRSALFFKVNNWAL